MDAPAGNGRPPTGGDHAPPTAGGGAIVLSLVAAGLLVIGATRRVPAEPGHGRPLPDMRAVPARDPLPVLDALPGVGPATAAAMQEAARRRPPVIGRDLREARGVGARTAARLAPHVRLGVPPPPPPPSPASSTPPASSAPPKSSTPPTSSTPSPPR